MARKPKTKPAPVADAPDAAALQRAYDAATEECLRLYAVQLKDARHTDAWRDACAAAGQAWLALKAAQYGKS